MEEEGVESLLFYCTIILPRTTWKIIGLKRGIPIVLHRKIDEEQNYLLFNFCHCNSEHIYLVTL